ncbi:MAG: carotenoid 1,2-hydratase [Betaproteobacteria bacterium]|nr:carotenoid 1,2-hydratase [Betaproteobacteria bacterium]
MTLIAFIGSVFSPYYARARARSDVPDPLNHCALNVALFDGPRRHWAMTERSACAVHASESALSIGPSSVERTADGLRIVLRERGAPWPSRISGQIDVSFAHWSSEPLALDARGAHIWTPHAPHAQVQVALDSPRWHWQGRGYVDGNEGCEPLERGFRGWQWSRIALPQGRTLVQYDTDARDGSVQRRALLFDCDGSPRLHEPLAQTPLPATRWGIARSIGSAHDADAAVPARLVRTLESGPFYARSLVRVPIEGALHFAMHESLSLDRFSQRWVQALLPFRMPRNPR